VWCVQVDGSLRIHAHDVMGATDTTTGAEPLLVYSEKCGRCRLENVTVHNAGVDWHAAGNEYWQNRVQRKEQLSIVLEGNSEFEAAEVTFRGAHAFVVPDGHRLMVRASAAAACGWEQELVPLVDGEPSWRWHYSLDLKDGCISLHMEESALYVDEVAAGEQTVEESGPQWRLAPWGRFRQWSVDGQGRPLGSRFGRGDGRGRRGKQTPPMVA
jgi:hypothetical protein